MMSSQPSSTRSPYRKGDTYVAPSLFSLTPSTGYTCVAPSLFFLTPSTGYTCVALS